MTPSALRVRPAGPEDFVALADLTAAVYVGEGYTPASVEARLRDVERRSAMSDVFVAVDLASGTVLGGVSLVRPGTSMAEVSREGEAEVRLLAVSPDARGRGAGEALMRACIARANDLAANRVILSTQVTMLAAQRLYERLGFNRLPDRDWVSSHGDKRLVYELELPVA